MSVPIQPLADYIVVQAEKAENKTASGLYIPDAAKEKPKTANVVAVGKNITDIKVGEKILYKNEYEATNVKIDGEEYVIVYISNVIATVK